MSVILTGNGNQIVMAAPGRPMLSGPPSGAVTPVVAANLSAIPGLAGWWDAGLPAGMLNTTGTPLTAFGTPAAAVADKSGATIALSVWHATSGGANQPIATPRLNGLLGGLGLNQIIPPMLPASGQQLPLMDPNQGLISAAMAIGSSTAWTFFLVWSRPNWRQSSNAAATLLSVGGTPILAGDNNGGGGRLVLFPGAQQTILTSALTRRHTHAVILRNTPGVGVDVWLDSTQVASAAPNPMAAALSAPLLFLHNGAAVGGSECWFHEAAVWSNALTATAIGAVLNYEARWITGPRKGIQIQVTGQSNAGNGLNDGAWHLLAQGVAWHLGALAFGVVGGYGGTPPSAATCVHGDGIYPVPANNLAGSFLTNPGDGSNPSTWNLGADGEALQAWIQVNTAAEDAADIVAILWPWSETDSTRQYSEKATYEAAARRLLSLERGMLNRSAASLPQVWWSAIPFNFNGRDAGTQMQREVVANMVADPTQNMTVVLPQTADTMPRAINGSSALVFNPTTGSFSGGDGYHRDLPDNQRFGMLAAPLVARAVLASEGGDTIRAIPAGVPAAGGPMVTHVYRQTNTSLIVTVQHDCGTDLIVPATLAASGTGWAVMDGGSVATPGTIVNATGCMRLNATQLQITLAQALVNTSADCLLFYPYGTATIGRGDAVTDNLTQVAPPVGWNIMADLGAATGVAAAFVSSAAAVEAATPGDCITTPWCFNMPVHIPMSTASGVVLSDTQ